VRRFLLILLTGCGRISFDLLGTDDAPTGDGVQGDGPVGDGPPSDGPQVRACHTDARYTGAAGLANTYREGTNLITWPQARIDCMADDADLWVVDSANEQSAFTGDWTGISDATVENEWRKLDGTVATFLPFLTGEPDGGDSENCIRTDPSGFEDRDCDDLRDFVCECPAP
jgi:lectin-like protein